MIKNSTLMLHLAEIETDLMIDSKVSQIDSSHDVNSFGVKDALQGVGVMSAIHDLEMTPSLIAYLADMETTVPNALYYFLAGRGQANCNPTCSV